MEIYSPSECHRTAWDAYVEKSPRATFYHQWGWKRVVENALHHRSLYLAAEKQGRISGILPLFLIRRSFGKPFITSVPAANYGGICADDRETALALLEKAKRLACESRAAYLELRDFYPVDYGLSCDRSHVTVLIPLGNDPDRVRRGLRKSVHHAVNKAARAGIRIHTGPTDPPLFHDLYSRNMRRLGSPCFGSGLFESILGEFPDTARIAWARLGSRTVAADLIVFFKDRILSLYAGTDACYLNLGTNSLLTWEIIRYGCQNGFACYDFGRSIRGSGSYHFKRRWNGEIQSLCYHYYMRGGNRLPVRNPMAPCLFVTT